MSAVILYTLLGFVGVPIIITRLVPSIASESIFTGRLRIKKAYFNPYTFHTEINQLSLTDDTGHDILEIDHAVANFQPLPSLFKWRFIFDEAYSRAPKIEIQLQSDLNVNWLQTLKPPKRTKKKSAKPFYLPPLEIKKITISEGELLFRDDHFNFTRRIGEISFSLSNFSTDPSSDNPLAFYCRTDKNTAIEWNGNLNFNPLSSSGQLRITDFKPSTYSAYYNRLISANIKTAAVDLELNYSANPASDSPELRIHDSAITFRDISIIEPGSDKTILETESVTLSGIDIDGISKDVKLKRIAIKGETLRISRERNNDINILEHLIPKTLLKKRTEIRGKIREVKEKLQSDPAGDRDFIYTLKRSLQRLQSLISVAWLAQLDELSLEHKRIAFIDRAPSETASLHLGPLALTIDNISNRDQQAAINLELGVGRKGSVKISGSLTPVNLSTKLRTKVRNLDLSDLSAYAQEYIAYPITRGYLNSTSDMHIEGINLDGMVALNLDNLELGQKIKREAAINLPFKLGLALLKDRDGQVNLPPLEIKGDITKPDFNIATLVGYAIRQAISNVVSAPFSFLAKLVGGSQQFSQAELEHIDNALGNYRLDKTQQAKLKIIAKALHARPQLQLLLQAVLDPEGEADEARVVFVEEQIETIRRDKDGVLSELIKERHNWNRDLNQKGLDRFDGMLLLYSRSFPERYPHFEQLLAAYHTDPRAAAVAEDPENPYTIIYDELLTNVQLTPPFWQQLANKRTQAALQAIQHHATIDPQRLIVKPEFKVGKAGIDLSLQ